MICLVIDQRNPVLLQLKIRMDFHIDFPIATKQGFEKFLLIELRSMVELHPFLLN